MSTTEIPQGPAAAAPFLPPPARRPWTSGQALAAAPSAACDAVRGAVAMTEVDMVADRPDVAVPLRQILLRLARHEEDLAASEAAAVSYWSPSPASVSGHRAAAEALRSEATASSKRPDQHER